MSEMILETRREAQDGGHSGLETQLPSAAVHNSPQGGDEGHRNDVTHPNYAFIAAMPREGRGGQLDGDAHERIASPQIRSDAEPSATREVKSRNAPRSATPSAKAEAGGHMSIGNHHSHVPGHNFGSEGHRMHEDQPALADASETVAVLRQLWRRRQRWHQAEKSLTLQCSAICRGAAEGSKTEAAKMLKRIEGGQPEPEDFDAMIATAPLLAARGVIRTERTATEKVLAKMVRKLPVYPWAKSVYGFGDLSLAAIVGEAGDVGSYKSVSALWKRMGLAVLGGERQRMRSGEAALEQGYSPRRRSVMWNIGGGLIGGMGRGPRLLVGEAIEDRPELTPYQRLFVERIRFEAARDPEMRRDPTKCPKTGLPRESFSAHAANRAKRYVEKRFLRELYSAWRAASQETGTIDLLLPANPIPANAGAERHQSGEDHTKLALGILREAAE